MLAGRGIAIADEMGDEVGGLERQPWRKCV